MSNYEYFSETSGIEVYVRPFYAEELSQPKQNKHVFVYKVRIKNSGKNPVKLISRKWEIIEDNGMKYIVEGEGVIGKQPIINPLSEFDYASQAVLYSQNGMMFGKYFCVDMANAEEIEVEIPAFSLDSKLTNEANS